MYKITSDLLDRYAMAHGVKPDAGHLRIYAIRNAVPRSADEISLAPFAEDMYKDTIILCGPVWMMVPGTSHPGAYWTEHPDNPAGAAHLISLANGGKVYHFKPGFHHGDPSNPCLVQAENFEVQRDANRDGIIDHDEIKIYLGQFGIHFHHGGSSANIGQWSAGCVVCPMPGWTKVWAAITATRQQVVSLVVVDGDDLYKFSTAA
jgi:hypothetical protein